MQYFQVYNKKKKRKEKFEQERFNPIVRNRVRIVVQ